MPSFVRIGGVWKTLKSHAKINGVWRRGVVWRKIGATWRKMPEGLHVIIDPPVVNVVDTGFGNLVQSGPVTATAYFNTGSVSYRWSRVSGALDREDIGIDGSFGSSGNQYRFTANMPTGTSRTAVWEVEATDTSGQVGTETVSITLSNP